MECKGCGSDMKVIKAEVYDKLVKITYECPYCGREWVDWKEAAEVKINVVASKPRSVAIGGDVKPGSVIITGDNVVVK